LSSSKTSMEEEDKLEVETEREIGHKQMLKCGSLIFKNQDGEEANLGGLSRDGDRNVEGKGLVLDEKVV